MTPFLTLSEPECERYLETLVGGVRRARLNRQFPDAKRMAAHWRLMSARAHRGLYQGLELHRQAGLPSYREWVRVQSDRAAFTGPQGALPPRAELEEQARRFPNSVFARQLLQHDYQTALAAAEIAEIDHVDVQLVRVDDAHRTAQFRVVMDKLDVDGTLSRTSIELSQTHALWREADLKLSGEAAELTAPFRKLIYTLSGHSAETLFQRLSADEHLSVYQVMRGVVGPFWLAGAGQSGPLTVMAEAGGEIVLSFGIELASREQAADRFNDPLTLPAQTSSEWLLSARQRLGYRVFQDRKFVVAAKGVTPLSEACLQRGCRNLVYSL